MSVKARLRTIVNGTDTWEGKTFDGAIIVLIFYAIAALAYSTKPALSEDARKHYLNLEKSLLYSSSQPSSCSSYRQQEYTTLSIPFSQKRSVPFCIPCGGQ